MLVKLFFLNNIFSDVSQLIFHYHTFDVESYFKFGKFSSKHVFLKIFPKSPVCTDIKNFIMFSHTKNV